MARQLRLFSPLIGCLLAVAYVAVALLGCASTKVVTDKEYMGRDLPRPDRILVYDLAVTPGEVRLDRSVVTKVTDAVKSDPLPPSQIEIGRKVADALAEYLVKHIRDLGLPAHRATGAPPARGNYVLVEGQFLSIDEGDRTKRVVIGLGAGRSDVEAHVQVLQSTDTDERLLDDFHIVAKSGAKPGMAETMGAGAAAGNVGMAAVMSTGMAGASEYFGANVEADARRIAKQVAKKMAEFFVVQGWITQAVVDQAF